MKKWLLYFLSALAGIGVSGFVCFLYTPKNFAQALMYIASICAVALIGNNSQEKSNKDVVICRFLLYGSVILVILAITFLNK